MADVVKVVDGMADETGKISDKLAANGKTYAQNYETMVDSLKDLSTQIPYTFEDLTRLAAAAGQSGKSFEDLTQTDFLKDVAMWGTAMDISADQAGNWAAQVGAVLQHEPRPGHGDRGRDQLPGQQLRHHGGGDRGERERGGLHGPDQRRGPKGHGGHRGQHARPWA